jgi:hypothetical protein
VTLVFDPSQLFQRRGSLPLMNHLSRLLSCRLDPIRCRIHAFSTTSATQPLRILFCGSDAYSIACLEPLAQILEHGRHNIASIDVLCRTDKMVGRGYQTLSEGSHGHFLTTV